MTTFRDVFTPNGQPTVTYVQRDNRRLEQKLRDWLQTDNMVISVSGPSKTGKTVLIRSVVDDDLLIPISGSAVKTEHHFWDSIFAWMESPSQVTNTTGTQVAVGGELQATGKIGIPVLAEGSVQGTGSLSRTSNKETAATLAIDQFRQVVREIGGSQYLIFLDDFHYIPKETQVSLAKAIKGLAENGVRVCTCSVPHRNEDVVRANPELRGRLASIDITEWDRAELAQIAERGFTELRANIPPAIINRLTNEAFGSPQLMQALCMNVCRELDLREALQEPRNFDVTADNLHHILEDTSDLANFGKLVELLHSGPKIHGVERKQFELSDGSQGDVYRALLLAICENPPRRDFNYEEITLRVRGVCGELVPVGSSITSSLGHMANIAKDHAGEGSVLEWEEEVLNIIDPYFAFYLRSSGKLASLRK